MSTANQAPKLDNGAIAIIGLFTIISIVAPFIIVNNYQTLIKQKQTAVKQYFETINSQTYTTSNFTTYGIAKKYNGYIGEIKTNSGFLFTFNSENKTTAKLSIKYESGEWQGGILKVNNETQNLLFAFTHFSRGTKEVVAQIKQGENTIEFCGGWLTDYAPYIVEIKITPDNTIKRDAIVGVWKGTYIENGTNGKGNLTLTVNDDMTGVFETSITGRQSKSRSIKASFIVSITCSNGNYSVRGKQWTSVSSIPPSDYSFDDLDGTVSNDIFSGRNFKLEKNATIPLVTVTKESEREQYNTTIKKENITEQNVDYTAKVETAISKAISACENGYWDDAYKYYTEAAGYPTDRSNQIKQTAANKFYEKAKGFIDRNGECDEFAKKLLHYANNLYSSNEIRNLLNICGGSNGATSSNSGRFPQASERILSSSDLSILSKYDLKIMRNEIFARHGYIFTTNDMKNYFQNQSWYSPRYSNVNSKLTSIEQQNIALIKKYE